MIENRLTAARREGGLQGLGEKVKGLSKKTKQNKTKNPHIHRQQYGDYQKEAGGRER